MARTTAWLAPKPNPGATAEGIAIAGEFSQASGLGEGARIMAAAARHLDLPVWTIDLPPLVGRQKTSSHPQTAVPPAGVPLVIHANAPTLPLALLRLPRAVAHRRHMIGYWAWETAELPAEWHPGIACVSQVWVPSRFTASVIQPHLSGKPVTVVPPALAVVPPQPSALSRADFGLPNRAVVVLVSFNLASSLHRKNPFAAIAAFRAAFGDRPDCILLLKVSHPEHAPGDYQRLREFADAPNIRFETRILPPADSHALTNCADIVVSLHRGEAFGLVMAEAMLLGKPVIATGWSGNTDYMDRSCAVLVGHRLIPARDNRAVYRGLWAEPDVAEAVDALRTLAGDALLRQQLGQHARLAIESRLTAEPLAAAIRGIQ